MNINSENLDDWINNLEDSEDLNDLESIISTEIKKDKVTTKISKHRLTQAWESGIINDKAYLWLILELFTSEDQLSHFEPETISALWEGYSGDRIKELTVPAINKALIDIQKSGLFYIKNAIKTFQLKKQK